MESKIKQTRIAKWSARIIALAIILFGLPFYFGYGNPLPFANPDYSWIENAWLTLVPLVFIGLALGWKYQKIGGYLIVIPIIIGFILGATAHTNLPMNILIALIPGILYLVDSYNKPSSTKMQINNKN